MDIVYGIWILFGTHLALFAVIGELVHLMLLASGHSHVSFSRLLASG